jgi:DNA mismatch repair ATPase MutS
MMRLEQWQQAYNDKLPRWFDALAEIEALASLSAFSYDNPGYVFPDISTDHFVIQAGDACHPLIPSIQRINNQISVTHRGHFNIITGANMAGKSTYLRTIGVNLILALAGAPVCAASFSCYPARIFTSLRTTDSLSTNKSYFYAELLRLKELIDRLNSGEELFILLDEILKGTNSTDKQAGSKALLTQLIGLGAAGFIATHDLELGNLINTFPEDVTNYCFEAEIIGEELHFDYKLKPGIAKNLNATFLMKKMGITI